MATLAFLDPLTRWWWRLVGREIDITELSWLDAPSSRTSMVDDDAWMAQWAERLHGSVERRSPGAGLIPHMSELAGPGLDPADIAEEIRDFYEHTSAWSMEAWAEWSPLFWPGGELISRLFGKRVQQLALPMRALDVARGMDSTVSVIRDADGVQQTAGWIRRLRSNGDKVFSGAYRVGRLPASDRASVHVTFPLENGSVQVYLRPRVEADGSLWLESLPGSFGGDGAYMVVRFGRRHFATRVPVHETFHLYLDESRVLRTDHVLKLWSATVVRLHYKLTPA
ncbi:hypothetical protein BW730_01565 [Tessaracoccus aquimaris]|uniref:DUF4166 domain-containing protein n=1 Tax=Tessaracoccus aquimaris TaxID=1332264 RepID=A0A1Q2CJY1_9ACTN|nr:hypothetical protein [Tessaracoccus aquimaris]AQP46439.1 hypothetical protein BW730_01565 [Tessaracoccus aquimaris]